MDLGDPLADIIPGPRGRILATLVQLSTPVTTRALAGHAGVSPQTTLTAVNELVDAGVLHAERAGTANLIELNRDHLLARPLVALGQTRNRLVEMLKDELAGWADLAGAWLFGSSARGDGGRHSDVDVLLVAKTNIETDAWAEATAHLGEHVILWTGNQAQLVEHTRNSFRRLVRDGNSLITAVRTEGVPLTPDSRALLRRSA